MKNYNPNRHVSWGFSGGDKKYASSLLSVFLLLLASLSSRAGDVNWALTNSVTGITGNFSDGTSWVGGVAPAVQDRAVFSITNANTPLVTVVASTNVEGFSFTVGTNAVADTAPGATFTINAGQQLSVLGADGFLMHNNAGNPGDPGPGVRAKRIFTFSGNALLVSNLVANFALNSGVTYNQGATWDTYTMSGLTNLTFWGNVFALGNGIIAGDLQTGEQENQVVLPQTNIITAWLANDYSQLDFTNSVEIGRQASAASSSVPQNSMVELGRYNVFNCDSFGLGRGFIGGNTLTMGISSVNAANGKNSAGYQVSFASVNSGNPTSIAIFRNTNGIGRMSLLAIGVDSGTSLTNSRNNGILNLTGGKVDMLVDQIWLGRNRTNAVGNSDCGGFSFENGTVDANIVRAGYMQFTNAAYCVGLFVVGTNGTMSINNYLELGHTPDDPLGDFAAFEPLTRGQVQVNNGGKLYVNQVNLGAISTNNSITINSGGLMVVSNTIASTAKGLDTLNINGGTLALFVSAGVTNVYVTNLLAATPTIQIKSIAGFSSYPATNVLISYGAIHASPQTYSLIAPTNFNNLQIYDDTVAQTINLIIKTNSPQNLVWRGGANNQWDHTSLNWVTTNNNTVYFSEGDSVTFNDTPGVPTTISIVDSVNPSQIGIGITVSNTVNNYTFNSGGGSIGSVTIYKTGTNALAFNCPSTATMQVDNGMVAGSGNMNTLTISANGSLNFSGTVNGAFVSSGNATLASGGQITGSATINGGTFNNNGTVGGALSAQPGSVVNNYGVFSSIGSSMVATNAVLNNAGAIYGAAGSTLTIAAGGTLTDTVQGTPDLYAAGSINLGTLIVAGTFNPGGTGTSIGTTKVTDHYDSGNASGTPNGRVQLNPGSITIFKVDTANSQPNTVVLSQNQVLGPSTATKAINGATLVITNVGASPFVAGQSFQLFGNYYNGGNFIGAGLNTTNTYPIIIPSVPGTGLLWDMSQLYFTGKIGVIAAGSVQITLTNNTYISDGTNIVSHLSWPADYIGQGWVQQQLTTLTNGLGTNWSNVGQSDYVNDIYLTNQISGSPAVFYRFVRP